MIQYFVVAACGGAFLKCPVLFNKDIFNPVAFDAADMIMGGGIAIKAFLFTTYFQFSDNTQVGEEIKIAVHGTQSDPG